MQMVKNNFRKHLSMESPVCLWKCLRTWGFQTWFFCMLFTSCVCVGLNQMTHNTKQRIKGQHFMRHGTVIPDWCAEGYCFEFCKENLVFYLLSRLYTDWFIWQLKTIQCFASKNWIYLLDEVMAENRNAQRKKSCIFLHICDRYFKLLFS